MEITLFVISCSKCWVDFAYWSDRFTPSAQIKKIKNLRSSV